VSAQDHQQPLRPPATLDTARIPALDLVVSCLPGLDLSGARIDGGAFLEGLTATGEVNANTAQVTGQLGLQHATLTTQNGIALTLADARIDGSAFLDPLGIDA